MVVRRKPLDATRNQRLTLAAMFNTFIAWTRYVHVRSQTGALCPPSLSGPFGFDLLIFAPGQQSVACLTKQIGTHTVLPETVAIESLRDVAL